MDQGRERQVSMCASVAVMQLRSECTKFHIAVCTMGGTGEFLCYTCQPLMQVKWTGDTRGYGAFAEQDIQAGTFIGTYEGELLGLEEYYTRYPDGVSDYCITGIDALMTCIPRLEHPL